MTTLRDVAKHAGVSISTVSLVLNDKGSISPETRQRVQHAVIATGYRRRMRNSARLGLVGHPHHSLLMQLYQAAAEFGCALHHMPWTAEDPGLPAGISTFSVDVLIILGGSWRPTFLHQVVASYPAVFLGCWAAHPFSDAVWVDNVQAIAYATQYLAERGHTRIGLLNGPPQSRTSAEKRLGFETALDAAAVGGVVADSPGFTEPESRQAAQRLLRADPELTAIIASEDTFGRALYAECRALGRSIPQDISVIVFRDHPHFLNYSPPLTAMALPELDIARETVRSAIKRLNAPQNIGRRLLLQPRLVERGSVLVK